MARDRHDPAEPRHAGTVGAGVVPAVGAPLGVRDVTVVVATKDRTAQLTAALQALRDGHPATPVIVCDDASGDAAGVARAADAVGARVLRLGRSRGAAARNAGLLEARTPLVAFCDDDSWWAPGALARAAEHFAADRRLGLVAGHVLVGPEARTDPVSELMARSPLGRTPAGPRVLGFLACAAVARRDALLAVGGFPARYGIGGEEAPVAIDLARAGWDLAYAPDVVAHHVPPRRRSSGERRVVTDRNDLWTIWRRRPLRTALRRTAAVAARAPGDPAARRTLLAAASGLPWVVRDRRVAGAALEAELRALDAQRAAEEDARRGAASGPR